jgi:hypothetical protein
MEGEYRRSALGGVLLDQEDARVETANVWYGFIMMKPRAQVIDETSFGGGRLTESKNDSLR